jgi:hypothetical protein
MGRRHLPAALATLAAAGLLVAALTGPHGAPPRPAAALGPRNIPRAAVAPPGQGAPLHPARTARPGAARAGSATAPLRPAAARGGTAADPLRPGAGSAGPAAGPLRPGAANARPAAGQLRPGAAAAFRRLEATLPGPVEVALLPLRGGRVTHLGGDAPARGWSTTKVPVLVALLRRRGAAGLSPRERAEARLAITASDNPSILELFGALGGPAAASGYVQAVLRASGDATTIVATAPPPAGAVTSFGQTEWTPGAAARFFRALAIGALLPPAQTAYVLGLMERIVPAESWGLGSAGFAVPVAFKGGWGPGPGGRYLVRQSGIVAPGSRRGVAVSLVAHPPAGPGSFATGTRMLTRTARWLRAELER